MSNYTFTRTGIDIEEIHNTVNDLPNRISNANLIPNSDFSTPGSVSAPPDSAPRSYIAGDELFEGFYAVGGLTGVTYINGVLNGSGQIYTAVYKTQKQKESTAGYVASVAFSDGLPISTGVTVLDSGDFWKVTFDISNVFSVKLELGSAPTIHEVGNIASSGGSGSGIIAVQKVYSIGDAQHPAGQTYLEPLDSRGNKYSIAGNTYLTRGAAPQFEGKHYTISSDRTRFELVGGTFRDDEDIFIGFSYFGSEVDSGGDPSAIPIESEIYVEKFAPTTDYDSITDWQPILQEACDYIATSGKRTNLIAGRSQYILGSLNTDSKAGTLLDGKKVALWVKRPDLVAFKFGRSEIKVDSSVPAMAAIDDVISVYSDGPTYESAGVYWEQVHVSGGDWPSESDEPDFTVRADYNAMRYCYFEDCEFRYARDTNFRLCGFAITMMKPDARFAGKRNYEFVTDALDGDSATRTSITLITPTADYAGFGGYRFSGVKGQTYLSMINPGADHIGRDRSGNTITANIPLAAAYDFSAVFNLDVISLGCEFSTRILRANGSRGLNIGSVYANDVGSTDALYPVDAAMIIEGVSGKVEIKNFNWTGDRNITNKIKIDVDDGSPFTLEKDGTILESDMELVNFKTSKKTPVADISDFYNQGGTSLGGVVVYGNPVAGRTEENWINQNVYMNEFDFLMTRGDVSDNVLNLLNVDDKSKLGQLGVHVTVKISKVSSSSPVAPATFSGGVTVYNGIAEVTELVQVSGPTSYSTLDLQMAGDTLSLFQDEDFSAAWVNVQVVGRPSTEIMTYKFED